MLGPSADLRSTRRAPTATRATPRLTNGQSHGSITAVVSASPGRMGAFGADHHLRQSLVFLDMPTMQQPELYIGGSYDLFGQDGRLLDTEMTRRFASYMERFVAWTTRNTKNPT